MSLPNPISYYTYRGQPLPAPELYAYIMAGQGLVKMAQSSYFKAAIPVALGDVVGLPEYPEGVELGVPKIPAKWLYAVLDHVRRCGYGIEQMYHFHWLNEWKVAVPKQMATAGRVGYRGGDELSVVLDLHSHHGMNSFFSSTDNNDEQGLRFYAVIGKIYHDLPEIRLRVGVYGDWLELDPLDLFDGLGPFVGA